MSYLLINFLFNCLEIDKFKTTKRVLALHPFLPPPFCAVGRCAAPPSNIIFLNFNFSGEVWSEGRKIIDNNCYR
jgi:hypothetical protein